MKNAQIHRFREKVAVSLPGADKTIYLDAKAARAIAAAMNKCSRDIKDKKFTDSEFSTVLVPVNNA